MKRPLRRRIVVVLAVLALTLAGSTALAYWSATGAGSGAGTTGTTAVVTLTPGTPTSDMYPGGQGDVSAVFDNPNSVRVHIGSLKLSTAQGTAGYTVDAGHAGCATSVLSFATQTDGGAGWTVPPKSGSTDGSLTVELEDALTMGATAANACQGATFDVYLTAGP
jgi:hypothetical protein